MAKTIAIVNQKGGVGKTTTCVNLAAALKALGSRVLVCDFDPQANTTSGFGVDKVTASPNIYDVLVNDADITKAIVHTDAAISCRHQIDLYSADQPEKRNNR